MKTIKAVGLSALATLPLLGGGCGGFGGLGFVDGLDVIAGLIAGVTGQNILAGLGT